MSNSNLGVNTKLGNNTTVYQENENGSQSDIIQEEIPIMTIFVLLFIIMAWIQTNTQLSLDYYFSEALEWDTPSSY
jgi:hypothetical protein